MNTLTTVAKKAKTTSTRGITKATITSTTTTPFVETQKPLQTDSDHNLLFHTVSDRQRSIPVEFVTFCYILICYFIMENLKKWMGYLLILTSLPCAVLLNCLILSSTTQTWPLNFVMRTIEKWMGHLFTLTSLHCAMMLNWLVLFIPIQIYPFNPVQSIFI